jgi:hypothetical protein
VPVGDGRFLLEDDGPLIAFEITGEEAVLILPADAEDPEALNRVEAADPDPDLLAEYEGNYFSPELGTGYLLILEGRRLIMRHRKLDDRNLRPTFVDGFNAGNRTLRFTRDSDGSISGFRMSSGRVRGVRFEKTGN